MKQIFVLLMLCFASLSARAEQVIEHGPYRLHYIAMLTTDLTPEIAKVYGVKRSKNRGIVVLNLQREDVPYVGVPSKASGYIRNLIGQERMKDLREVAEQEALYQIAEFRFSHLETMRFHFELVPQDNPGAGPITLKFHQQFYTPGK